MKAAVVTEKGAKWQVREIPTPKPGPNQVLIQIKASGLCFTDVHITNGALPIQYPSTLGHEPVGEVVELGPGVTERKRGDRVGVPWVQKTCGRCEWCARKKYIFCPEQIGTGVGIAGGHAEYMVAYANRTFLIPDALSFEQAAPIFCAGYTVWSGLRIADPKPHEKIAVVGIGGLGHLAVQYAKAAGFHTTAITHSKDKEKLVRDLGADQVIPSGKALGEAGGADVLLVTSNSYKATLESMDGMRPDGRVIIMGLSDEPLNVPLYPLLMKRLRLIGSLQNEEDCLVEALDYAAQGKVKVIFEEFSLDDIRTAYDKVAKGDVRFRAVIKPSKN